MHIVWSLIALFTLGLAPTVHALCESDKSACVAALTKHTSLHDGPNCFNAALVAAGLMDEIVYVDSLEYAFYLEFFCQAQPKNRNAAGNVLVYLGIEPSPLLMAEENIQILHGAYSLGSGKILEKTSNAGSLFGKNEGRERAGVYQIKPLPQSAFATKESGTKSMMGYRCLPPTEVAKQIAVLNADPLAQQMFNLRIQFTQKLQTQPLSKITGLAEQLKLIRAALKNRKGNSKIDLYLAALSRSLVGTIETVVDEDNANYDEEIKSELREFLSTSFELVEKVNTKTNFSKTKPLLLKY